MNIVLSVLWGMTAGMLASHLTDDVWLGLALTLIFCVPCPFITRYLIK